MIRTTFHRSTHLYLRFRIKPTRNILAARLHMTLSNNDNTNPISTSSQTLSPSPSLSSIFTSETSEIPLKQPSSPLKQKHQQTKEIPAQEKMAKISKIAKSLKKQNTYQIFPISTSAISNLPYDQRLFLLEELKRATDPNLVDFLNLSKLLSSDRGSVPNYSHNDTLDLLNVTLKPSAFAYYEKLFSTLIEGKGYDLFNEKIYDAAVRKEVSVFYITLKDIRVKIEDALQVQKEAEVQDEELIEELSHLLKFYQTKGFLVDTAGNVLEVRPEGTLYPLERLNKLQPSFIVILEQMNLRVEAYTCKSSKALKRIQRDNPNDEVLQKIINRRLIDEFGFDGCFDSIIVDQIRAVEQPGEKKARALDKTKVKDLFPVIFEPKYTHNQQQPFLRDFVSDIDDSIHDIEFLKTLTQHKLKQLQQYLNEVNTTRKKHGHLHNDASFIGLTECLRMGTSLMDSFISIDIEAFEFSQQKITEIGISIYDPLKEALSIAPNFINIHILIKEHLHLRNGKFVVDNKDKYLCGGSIILSERESLKFIQSLLDHYLISRFQTHGMNSILVGHDIKGDIKWLKQMGIHLPVNVKSLDTQIIARLANGSEQLGLGKILNRYGIPHSYLHNAGNDAYFTLLLLLKLVDVGFRKSQKIDFPVNKYQSIENVPQVNVNSNTVNIKKMRKPYKSFEFSEQIKYQGYGEALKGIYKQES